MSETHNISLKCPYCNSDAELVDASVVYGIFGKSGKLWVCKQYPVCDSYATTKPNSTEPRGALANRELRERRRIIYLETM